MAPSMGEALADAPIGVVPHFAGYSCLEGLGDSNLGTTAEDCANDGDEWEACNCDTANGFWLDNGGPAWEYAEYFQEPWS